MRANLKMHQKVLIALVALFTMGLLLAVGVWAYDDAQKDQIAPGVKVGGVDVGGRDADSARKIIEHKVVAPLKQPVVVSYNGKDYTLGPKRLHERADVDGMVQEAIDRSRQGNILDRVSSYASGGEVNADLQTAREVRQGRCSWTSSSSSPRRSTRSRRTPRSFLGRRGRLMQDAGQAGLALDIGETTAKINQAARSPGRDQPIEPVVKQDKPDVTTKDLSHEPTRATSSSTARASRSGSSTTSN